MPINRRHDLRPKQFLTVLSVKKKHNTRTPHGNRYISGRTVAGSTISFLLIVSDWVGMDEVLWVGQYKYSGASSVERCDYNISLVKNINTARQYDIQAAQPSLIRLNWIRWHRRRAALGQSGHDRRLTGGDTSIPPVRPLFSHRA